MTAVAINLTCKRIKSLLNKADALDATAETNIQTANTNRWEAARLMVEQLDSGKTQTALAVEIGRSQTYVSLCTAVWRDHGSLAQANSQPFGELFTAYSKIPAKDRKATVEKAQATGKSAATMANNQRRQVTRRPPTTTATAPLKPPPPGFEYTTEPGPASGCLTPMATNVLHAMRDLGSYAQEIGAKLVAAPFETIVGDPTFEELKTMQKNIYWARHGLKYLNEAIERYS